MGVCASCHVVITNSSTGYTFAINESTSNPATSLFILKPSGQVAHGGLTVWPVGGGSYNAAVAWINGGRNP